ncbi:hypothetical protein ACHAWX_000195, partial [Stephanocyclus meneghinianus]
WTHKVKLTAADGAASDYFGYSVGISGNVVVVGAYLDDDRGSQSGGAYMFFGLMSKSISNPPSKSPSKPPTSGCLPNASKIKLQSVTGSPIQMFEVEVFSSSDLNIAFNKVAIQSSDLNGNSNFAAAKAVDGNKRTFSHTAMGSCSWWEVDLGGSFPISLVKILNRWCTDQSDPKGCLCRLSYVAVSLLDDKGMWVDATLTGNLCKELEWIHVFENTPNYCIGS